MKLSEAMRKGAQLTLPGQWDLFRQEEDGMHACALGAVLAGAGHDLRDFHLLRDGYEILRDEFPQLQDKATLLDGMGEGQLEDLIWRLNDVRNFSREQIADLLEAKGY